MYSEHTFRVIGGSFSVRTCHAPSKQDRNKRCISRHSMAPNRWVWESQQFAANKPDTQAPIIVKLAMVHAVEWEQTTSLPPSKR